ncbi:Mitochondrial thiamine pyrophosphate carrier 1 [Candida viswanathii]|uniref:Mitochondrial thiamine pyrophosphate carrier 1 n=1 Tax=Candida viswanathii TaxID=5486 RepID=A0A367XM27_9ASCO|nr:Mitochondrial thiamine pyrophosphate carrier 1 [Candida viswanathii]
MTNKREDHLKRGSDVTPLEALTAGSIAGAVSRAVTAPLDTIKIRLQLESSGFKERNTVPTIIKNLLRHEGPIAFWKGNVPAEILYILYGGTQFASYSVLNTHLLRLEQLYHLRLSEASHSLIVGTGSGMASTLVTYPFDLLRTRLVANKTRNLLSMSGTVRGILETEGIRGVFAGVRPAMLSVSTTSGLMFWSYELAREFSKNLKHVPFIEGICGFIAGAFAKGVTFPLDTLRKRCQMCSVVHGHPFSALHLFVAIVKKEGVLGLYKGFGVSIIKTAPTSAISLFMYEYSLSFIKKIDL